MIMLRRWVLTGSGFSPAGASFFCSRAVVSLWSNNVSGKNGSSTNTKWISKEFYNNHAFLAQNIRSWSCILYIKGTKVTLPLHQYSSPQITLLVIISTMGSRQALSGKIPSFNTHKTTIWSRQNTMKKHSIFPFQNFIDWNILSGNFACWATQDFKMIECKAKNMKTIQLPDLLGNTQDSEFPMIWVYFFYKFMWQDKWMCIHI